MAIKGITIKYKNKNPIAFVDDIYLYGFETDNNRDLNAIISYKGHYRANRVFQDKLGPYFIHYNQKYYIENMEVIK